MSFRRWISSKVSGCSDSSLPFSNAVYVADSSVTIHGVRPLSLTSMRAFTMLATLANSALLTIGGLYLRRRFESSQCVLVTLFPVQIISGVITASMMILDPWKKG